jgi:hypothetical protein
MLQGDDAAKKGSDEDEEEEEEEEWLTDISKDAQKKRKEEEFKEMQAHDHLDAVDAILKTSGGDTKGTRAYTHTHTHTHTHTWMHALTIHTNAARCKALSICAFQTLIFILMTLLNMVFFVDASAATVLKVFMASAGQRNHQEILSELKRLGKHDYQNHHYNHRYHCRHRHHYDHHPHHYHRHYHNHYHHHHHFYQYRQNYHHHNGYLS